MGVCVCVCVQTYVVDGFVDGLLLRRWCAKTSHHKLPFVQINDELRRQTSWPPPSQLGGSLVDIMKLENSFFQVEQTEEALLPKSASDFVPDVSDARLQTELKKVNDIAAKNECSFSAVDSSGVPINLEPLPAVSSGEPQLFDGTIL